MVNLKCKNPKCIKRNKGKPYEWEYNGKNTFYGCCPRCKSSVKIPQEDDD